MTAKLLDGKKISAEIKEELKGEVAMLNARGITPGLSGIIVGDDPGSVTYVGLKAKACEEVGVREAMRHLPETISQSDLLYIIESLNNDPGIHGIFVQLPLPVHLSEEKILAAVSPDKDVDGFQAVNVGKAWLGQSAFVPAVALAMQEMLHRGGYSVKNKEVVIVNVDNLVGKPLASILIHDRDKSGANITLCQPSTSNLAEFTRRADVLVSAVNKPRFITEDMVKEGAVVLDFGASYVDDPVTGKRKTVGDVDFETVKLKAEAISPVPGGIGPLLITMLLASTIWSAKKAAGLA